MQCRHVVPHGGAQWPQATSSRHVVVFGRCSQEVALWQCAASTESSTRYSAGPGPRSFPCPATVSRRVRLRSPCITTQNPRPGCFFFVVAPFCSCPASLVSRKFFAVGPGCAKCFFCCAPLGAATFRRGQSKKKTTPPRVFFFLLRPRGKAGEGEAPLGAGTGPEQKKNTTQGVFFFAAAPRAHSLTAGKGRRSLPLGVSPARGQSKKKNTAQVFFFLLRPRADAHSLTAGLGGDASPWPGWCLFFLLRSKKKNTGPGWCFFFAVAPPGRSLTHCGLGRFRQGPGGVFFLLRPRRVFLDNNKKCLGYYIGSKKTRRGHSKKKKHHFPEPPGGSKK